MSDEDEAFDQDEEDDELEADADEAAAIDVDDVDEAVDDDEEEEPDAIAAKPVARTARSETSEAHSVEARDKVRKSLAADVEAFLARGGSIKTIAEDQRAEAPKKPDSSFGRRSV
jgi:SutA RNAP-binding domain